MKTNSIPKGWRKLRKGTIAIDGDKRFSPAAKRWLETCNNNGFWKVGGNEFIYIRKIK